MEKCEFIRAFEMELATWKMIDGWFASRTTASQIKIMAATYADELFDVMSHNLMKQSFSIARRENKTVPSIAGFIEADLKAKANPAKEKQLAISETTCHELTDEEVEINKKRVSILLKVAVGEISKERGEELQKELLKEKRLLSRMGE